MERMVLLDKENIKKVITQLENLEKIGKEEELKKFKIQQATTEIRTILGAAHWILDKQVQLKE